MRSVYYRSAVFVGGTYLRRKVPSRYAYIDRESAYRLVTLLYEGALLREPDEQGLYSAMDAIARGGYPALIQVAAGIGGSAEFRTNISPYYAPETIVTNLYRVLLGRDADPSGMQSWVIWLQAGRPDQVLSGIVGSREFYHRHVGY